MTDYTSFETQNSKAIEDQRILNDMNKYLKKFEKLLFETLQYHYREKVR